MMMLQVILELAAQFTPYLTLVVCGAVLSIRSNPVFSIYIVAAVVRILSLVVISLGFASAQYAAFSGPLSDHQEATLYAISAVSWVDSAVSPAIIFAAIVSPLLWHMHTTRHVLPSDPD